MAFSQTFKFWCINSGRNDVITSFNVPRRRLYLRPVRCCSLKLNTRGGGNWLQWWWWMVATQSTPFLFDNHWIGTGVQGDQGSPRTHETSFNINMKLNRHETCSAFWKRIGIDVAHPGIGNWLTIENSILWNILRQDSRPRRTSICALLSVGLLLPLPSGERRLKIQILDLRNTKAILFYIPRWLWKNWEAGKVSVIISLRNNIKYRKQICQEKGRDLFSKAQCSRFFFFSGCRLDDGSQLGYHLRRGEAAEEEVDSWLYLH